ncbi:MAG: hypothetical protein JNK49_04620 [Planctomycetes bacterium]|nr:hypothetical protein [Planctomycetota bacterium]
MKLTITILSGLLGSCALPHAPGGEAGTRPRLPVVVCVDGQPQPREVRFKDVRAGQVLVEGVWTVLFSVDDADMAWIRDLAARHEAVALEWEGREVWKFGARPHGDGYFIDRGFSDEVTARRVAEEVRTKQLAPAK